MKALILNSGMGTRMGPLNSEHPKCMTEVYGNETILSRQLSMLSTRGISEVVITTGPFHSALVNYCHSLNLPLNYTFVHNPKFRETNYIYSIYCAREALDDDILLMHGDLVFESSVLDAIIESKTSCMTLSSALPLPQKDFKAIIEDGKIKAIGIDLFIQAVAAQPLYKLLRRDLEIWLKSICRYCESGKTECYAENAFNEVSDACNLYPLEIEEMLCSEIDCPEDLAVVSQKVKELSEQTVYMCFSTDVIHSGHIAIIQKARRLGKLVVGVLSDEAIVSYKRFPLLPYAERKAMFESINGVFEVVEQRTLSYRENILKFRPAFVVHGDDWVNGFQRPIRDEVVSVLSEYGGKLIEPPYSNDPKYKALENRARAKLSLPDLRRSRLKKVLSMKSLVTAMEAHSGITGLIVEKTAVHMNGETHQFDAIWISSLCDSTAKGKPDIELVDMTSRFRTIDDIVEVTTKPIIFDGDTGGLAEHFAYTVRSLERMGVSMVIIEDKTGLKKNSLFGNDVPQTQDSIESFCEKISAGKQAQKTNDFMICARIESLILDKGLADALERAFAFIDAGADAIMIHSRKTEPDEIFEFADCFRRKNSTTPIVVVPTCFNAVTEEEFKSHGINVVIYANQFTRSGFPAMKKTAESILVHHRAKEADEQYCMPIKEIITLIPEQL